MNDLKVEKNNSGQYKVETGPLDFEAAMKRKREIEQARKIAEQNTKLKNLLVIAALIIITLSAFFFGLSLTQLF